MENNFFPDIFSYDETFNPTLSANADHVILPFYHTNRVSLIETTDIIEIGIDEFTKDKDLLLVHKNGVLLTEMEDYIIADDNMYILNINDYWNEGEDFYFIVINGDSNYYVEGLESKINTIQRQISSITKVLLNLQSRIK